MTPRVLLSSDRRTSCDDDFAERFAAEWFFLFAYILTFVGIFVRFLRMLCA
jgi:hypothetical protein